MYSHLKKLDLPKEAWDVLARLNNSNIDARKVHLKQRLHNVWRGNQSINDNVTEIKQLEEDLVCINVDVLDDDLVAITLNGLGPDYKSLDTSISVCSNMPDFEELVALCLQEEVKLGKIGGASSSQSMRDQVFYSRGRGFNQGAQSFCGGRGN